MSHRESLIMYALWIHCFPAKLSVFDDSFKSYPANLHCATKITCSTALLQTQPRVFHSQSLLVAGLSCRNILPAAWGDPVGKGQTQFTLCLAKP